MDRRSASEDGEVRTMSRRTESLKMKKEGRPIAWACSLRQARRRASSADCVVLSSAGSIGADLRGGAANAGSRRVAGNCD